MLLYNLTSQCKRGMTQAVRPQRPNSSVRKRHNTGCSITTARRPTTNLVSSCLLLPRVTPPSIPRLDNGTSLKHILDQPCESIRVEKRHLYVCNHRYGGPCIWPPFYRRASSLPPRRAVASTSPSQHPFFQVTRKVGGTWF